jgi:hypothetical protein
MKKSRRDLPDEGPRFFRRYLNTHIFLLSGTHITTDRPPEGLVFCSRLEPESFAAAVYFGRPSDGDGPIFLDPSTLIPSTDQQLIRFAGSVNVSQMTDSLDELCGTGHRFCWRLPVGRRLTKRPLCQNSLARAFSFVFCLIESW